MGCGLSSGEGSQTQVHLDVLCVSEGQGFGPLEAQGMVASQFFPCRNGARVARASRKSLKLYFYLKSPDLQMLTTNGETKTLCRPPKVVSIAGTQLATSLQHGYDMI